ncbi:hypothetical protein [Ornithinimicrobium panacihumi]|uniref:hypothetical protein n=1 Tax=Ornithinimicrobium panacihumi TaxID=2008449 RepID=UPI003F8BB634
MDTRTRAAWTAISSSTLLLSAAAVALPVQAAPPPPAIYDALGDSWTRPTP